MTKLIERNTTIPAKKSEVFSTAADSQTSVDVHVLQGERDFAKDNRTLGNFSLVGLPPAPRGVPKIEVTFDIDANGIVNVTAKDMATGKTQQITITSSSGLAKDEVERMVREASSNADADKKKREVIDLRNQIDGLAYNIEKLLKDNKDKISEADAKPVEEAIAKARKSSEAEDAAALKSALSELEKVSHKLAEELYKKTQSTAGPAAGDPTNQADGGGPAPNAGPAGRPQGRRGRRRVRGQARPGCTITNEFQLNRRLGGRPVRTSMRRLPPQSRRFSKSQHSPPFRTH